MTKRDRRSERADDVLLELRAGDAMSTADLVKATGISRPTVISILSDLESSVAPPTPVVWGGLPQRGRSAMTWESLSGLTSSLIP